MSGHSKWHNIQAKKGKADAKRGKVFTKIGKEIAVAVKEGGSNLDSNSRLRDTVSKAKSNNMPMDNITRAIKKAAGETDSVNYEEIIYEGYGPSGVAFMVEALTDNRNRTAGDVRHAFERHAGNLGTSGCVAYMFEKKGLLVIEKTDETDEDELMMKALEAGAEDFSSQDDVYEIITAPENFSAVRDSLEKDGINFISAEMSMIPNMTTAVDENTAGKVQKLIDVLEDNDDIQNVWHNAEFPEGWEAEE